MGKLPFIFLDFPILPLTRWAFAHYYLLTPAEHPEENTMARNETVATSTKARHQVLAEATYDFSADAWLAVWSAFMMSDATGVRPIKDRLKNITNATTGIVWG